MKLTFSVLNAKRLRFLVVGGLNALNGYLITVAAYKYLYDSVNLIVIGLLVNFLTITISFLVYKLFVFKTTGRWINEWLKSFLVYGFSALFSTFAMWLLLDYFKINLYAAPMIIMLFMYVFSLFAHANFTFKR